MLAHIVCYVYIVLLRFCYLRFLLGNIVWSHGAHAGAAIHRQGTSLPGAYATLLLQHNGKGKLVWNCCLCASVVQIKVMCGAAWIGQFVYLCCHVRYVCIVFLDVQCSRGVATAVNRLWTLWNQIWMHVIFIPNGSDFMSKKKRKWYCRRKKNIE